MINVLLVDDHEMVRIGVGAYLSAQADIHVKNKFGSSVMHVAAQGD